MGLIKKIKTFFGGGNESPKKVLDEIIDNSRKELDLIIQRRVSIINDIKDFIDFFKSKKDIFNNVTYTDFILILENINSLYEVEVDNLDFNFDELYDIKLWYLDLIKKAILDKDEQYKKSIKFNENLIKSYSNNIKELEEKISKFNVNYNKNVIKYFLLEILYSLNNGIDFKDIKISEPIYIAENLGISVIDVKYILSKFKETNSSIEVNYIINDVASNSDYISFNLGDDTYYYNAKKFYIGLDRDNVEKKSLLDKVVDELTEWKVKTELLNIKINNIYNIDDIEESLKKINASLNNSKVFHVDNSEISLNVKTIEKFSDMDIIKPN